MTEREKMMSGELFDTNDPELMEKRAECQRLLTSYRNCDPGNEPSRAAIASQLFQKPGKAMIAAPIYCEFGSNVSFEDFAIVNVGVTFVDYAPITIGKETYFAPGVVLNTLARPIDSELRNKGLAFALPINIEEDVWLGSDTVVMPGVTIGKRSIVGAGSVVTCDIPPDVVAVGKPCRVMRPITDRDKDSMPPEELYELADQEGNAL